MRLTFIVALLLCWPLGGSASNAVFLAASATGGQTGTDCADAKAYTYFNSSGNWSATPSGIQIGPGTIVHICGTITDSAGGTLLTAQGSGASGSPVTILFQSGASLQSPAENNFINGNNQSHFIIDGGTTCGWISLARVTCNGLIENTLNGFSGQTCPGGPCTYQSSTIAIANFSTDLEVRNLQIGPIYIHGNTSDETFTSPGPICIQYTNGGTALNIHNNIMHDAGWCLNALGTTSTIIANNEIYNMDHGDGAGQYSDTASTLSNISIHDNYLHDQNNWDQANDAFHHDGFHLFSYCATLVNGNNTVCPNTIITGVNIYNNVFGGNFGGNYNANVFFEGYVENANVFNNVTVSTTTTSGAQLADGAWNGYGQNVNYFNNTDLGTGSANQTYKMCGIIPGTTIVFENNICADGAMVSIGSYQSYPLNCPVTTPQGTVNCVVGTYTIKTDAYLAPADFSNGFGACTSGDSTGASCNGFFNFNSSGFTSFETTTTETGGVFRDTTEPKGTWLNSTTGAEISGSPTIGAGTNLTSFCTGLSITGNPCLSDIAGNARPGSGAWDIGAYQFAAGVAGVMSGGTISGATLQ